MLLDAGGMDLFPNPNAVVNICSIEGEIQLTVYSLPHDIIRISTFWKGCSDNLEYIMRHCNPGYLERQTWSISAQQIVNDQVHSAALALDKILGLLLEHGPMMEQLVIHY